MRLCSVVLLFAALAAAAPAVAAGRSGGILPGASAKDPLNIDAGKLDYFEKEQKLIYSGSVIVTQGPSTLKASRLIIFLEGKGAGQPAETTNDRVKHFDVVGPVTLVSKDQIGS
ncbi:MAG: LptA/OstA family protein, partial [Methylocystis sp.]